MSKYVETTKKDWTKTILFISIFVAVIVIGAILLVPEYIYVWLVLVIFGVAIIVKWHASNFAYRCPRCGNEFEISFWKDFLSPHGPSKNGGWKYLKCPKCQNKSRATLLRKNKTKKTT